MIREQFYIIQRHSQPKGSVTYTQTEVRKRESIDIISEILGSVAEGVNAKTHLQQRSNLDTREMKRYMAVITEKGFLSSERNDGHESYRLTERGRGFLQAYSALEGFLD